MSILELVLPLLLLSTSCRAANPIFDVVTPQKDYVGSQDTKIDYKLPKGVVPTEYKITLQPNIVEDAFTFSGFSSITIKVEKKNNTIVLHAKNLKIDGDILLDIKSKKDNKDDKEKPKYPKVAQKYTTDETRDFLIITFADEIPVGEYILTLKYDGIINDNLYGFYRSSYKDENGKTRWLATTQFEPVGARQAFPCWDEPAIKAVFYITIRHLSQFKAISNMAEGKAKDLGHNLLETTFPVTPKMSTYLVAFVVADYDFVESNKGKYRVWTKKHTLEQAEYALEIGEKALTKLNEYTEISYFDEMTKLDQISIPDFQAGAMENWGLVTYREKYLLHEKGVTTTIMQQGIAETIAHELAHQWFGNLVTLKSWTYVWLNEGFATYFQYYTIDEITDKWRMMEQMVVKAMQGRAFITDATTKTRPMNAEGHTPTEIRALFDTIAYQKAACVIRMMANFMTEKVFQKGLRVYLKNFNHTNTEPNDLFETLQKAIDEDKSLGKDFNLRERMDAWINKEGYPTINVMRDEKTGKLVINQTQFTLTGSERDNKWWVPLNYATEEKPDFGDTTASLWLKPKDKTVEVSDVAKDKWVIFNKKQTGYYRVNYDEGNWERLREYLQSKDFEKIDPLNRAQLIDDAFYLARAGDLSYNIALSLSTYLKSEADYIPWVPAFRTFDFFDRMLASSKRYPKFLTYVKDQVKTLIETVKYEADTKDDHITKLNRVHALRWACAAGIEECNNYVNKKLDDWLKDSKKNALNVDLRREILCAAVRNADKDKWGKVLEKYNSMEDSAEKLDVVLALGCSKLDEALEELISLALKKKSSIENYNDALDAVITGNPKGYLLVLNAFMNNYNRIKELDPTGTKTKEHLDKIGMRITDSNDFLKFNMFVAKKDLAPEISYEGIKNAGHSMDWVTLHQEEVEDWFKSYSSSGTTSIVSFLVVLPLLIARLF